ncbi:MAG: VOC family protein [Bacillota bacterium]|nr:VOC family protein [Bacillota bacterium]
MIGRIYHVGITVSDMDKSIAFYRDVLGLEFQGEIIMDGENTDKLFNRKNCRARVAYLNGSKNIETPPVELIQFIGIETNRVQSDLFTTSISEVCFYTDDIDQVYENLVENNVECLSKPQSFDFTLQGFGRSKAFYFKDPDGIILEMMQPL